MPYTRLHERFAWETPLRWLAYLLLLSAPFLIAPIFRFFDLELGIIPQIIAFCSLAFPLYVFETIGKRIRHFQAAAQKDAPESQPCLMVDGILQSPAIVSYRDGQLEFRPLVGPPVAISPAAITAIRETRWFNGKLLIGKTAFWLQIPGRPRLGFAVPNSTAPSWRERLYVTQT